MTAKNLRVQYVPTQHQITDILTKPLPIFRFEIMRAKLNVIDWLTFSRGSEKEEIGNPQTSTCIAQV